MESQRRRGIFSTRSRYRCPPEFAMDIDAFRKLGLDLDADESEDFNWAQEGRQAKPVDWVVQGLLSAAAVIFLAGPAKHGRKTWTAMDLIAHVARGMPWLGHATSCRPGIYSFVEGGRERVRRRIAMLGQTGDDLATGHLRLNHGYGGHDRTFAALLRAAHEGREAPILWVIDSLALLFARAGVREIDNAELTTFLLPYALIAHRTRATIVVITHFAKYAESIRGGTAQEATIDGWCSASPVKGAADGTVRLDWTLRDAVGPSQGVRLADHGGCLVLEEVDLHAVSGTNGVGKAGQLGADCEKVWAFLLEAQGAGQMPLSANDVVAGVQKRAAPRRFGAKRIRDALASLEAQGRAAPINGPVVRYAIAPKELQRVLAMGQVPPQGAEIIPFPVPDDDES